MSHEIITQAQGVLIDRSKAYLAASERSLKDAKAYAYLAGRALLALKEATPHGQFEVLKERTFEMSHRATIGRYMQFAEALGAKNAVAAVLPADRLLAHAALTETEQEKIVTAVTKATGGRGIIETIRDYQKKKHQKPRTAPTPDELVQARLEQAVALCDAVLDAITVLLASQALGIVPPAKRQELLDHGVRLNEAIRRQGAGAQKVPRASNRPVAGGHQPETVRRFHPQ